MTNTMVTRLTKLKPVWKCSQCDEIHDDEGDAYECCLPRVSDGYLCPVCGNFHYEHSDALDCCGYDEDEPPPPTAAEL